MTSMDPVSRFALIPSSFEAAGFADATRPTGANNHLCDRYAVTSVFTPTSGTVYLFGKGFYAGQVVTNIGFMSAVGITSPTHWQFGLYSAARSLLASSTDQTGTAWGTNTQKLLAMQAAYTIPTSGLYYVGMFYTGSALQLRGPGVTDQIAGILPILSGSADAGVTALPSNAAALTQVQGAGYWWTT